MSAGRRFLGRAEFLATRCPCCGATDANTRHVHLCHRSGAQVNHHQPLVHALSHTLKRMSIRHQVESGAPFNAERDPRMDIVIERGGSEMLRRRSIATKRYCSTSRTQTHKRWATCMQAALTETGWLLPNLRRASAATTCTLDRDKCPSTSAALNSLSLIHI